MPGAFVQALLTGSGPTPAFGSNIYAITGSPKTVTVGNTIIVVVATPNPANAMTMIDNLGNVYNELLEFQTNGLPVITNTEQHIFAATITVGGSLTQITASWSGGVTSCVLCSAEFFNAQFILDNYVGEASGNTTSLSVTTGSVSGFLLNTLVTWHDAGTVTPPTGYSLASSFPFADPSAYLFYKFGTDTGTVTTSWTSSREATLTRAVIPIPAQTVSFDGPLVK